MGARPGSVWGLMTRVSGPRWNQLRYPDQHHATANCCNDVWFVGKIAHCGTIWAKFHALGWNWFDWLKSMLMSFCFCPLPVNNQHNHSFHCDVAYSQSGQCNTLHPLEVARISDVGRISSLTATRTVCVTQFSWLRNMRHLVVKVRHASPVWYLAFYQTGLEFLPRPNPTLLFANLFSGTFMLLYWHH